METMPSYSIPTLYSPPGKRKRVNEDEEEKCFSLDHLNLPLLSSPFHLSSHPYSKLIATLASSYSTPLPTPQPQPKRRREDSPIDLSPTADSEDLLDVVSVDDVDEKESREKEEEERRERAQKLQRLIAAAMFHRGQQ